MESFCDLDEVIVSKKQEVTFLHWKNNFILQFKSQMSDFTTTRKYLPDMFCGMQAKSVVETVSKTGTKVNG